MNARRIHQLFRQRFPAIDSVSLEWVNVGQCIGEGAERFSKLLDEHISAPEVLVEIHRSIGALMPRNSVLPYVAEHVGQGQIRIADRDFTSFVVVAVNGAATGWRVG